MKKNAIMPYILIMVFGIGLVVALSLVDVGNSKQQANGKDEQGETVQLTPEEIYQQKSCISCHGENYDGSNSVPGLKGVGDKLSDEEIKEVLVNGKGIMPGGLVPENSLDEMVEWLKSLN
ncbi:cytochrome c550 [Bacillus kwashiorkori]|uniref:cytochrome c550 n=1 Tax=Bacillus kwashiorkori TaxID=1522318 RepID=UPI000782D26F|nr:cytochrome c [Bacillus kwashiorkori]